jgi:DNA adenine methylase
MIKNFRHSMHPYPGSKRRMLKDIVPLLEPHLATRQYREPFLGGGSIYAAIAGECPQGAWINDLDPPIAALWYVVRDHDLCHKLIRHVRCAQPEQEARRTNSQKAVMRMLSHYRVCYADDLVDIAVAKLKLHAHTFGAAGCVGGARPAYQIDKEGRPKHRWSPSTIIPAATALNFRMWRDRTRITCADYMPMLADPNPAIVYLDPPYVQAGKKCYAQGTFDHVRLAAALRECPHPWVLSYDGHPLIRELYAFADIKSRKLDSTLSHARGRDTYRTELIITPRDFVRNLYGTA